MSTFNRVLKKSSVLFAVCLLLSNILNGQNQTVADSLELVYLSGEYQDKDKLSILKQLAQNLFDNNKKLSYSEELIETALRQDSVHYVLSGYFQKGNAYRLKGDLSEALESFFKSAEIAVEHNLDRDLGLANATIADIYSFMNNHDNAIIYYQKSIELLRRELSNKNDSIGLASALLNAGDEYFNYDQLDSALVYFAESGAIFNNVNYEIGKAYNLGNIGLVYAQKGDHIRAEENINEAVIILEELGDYYPICVYFTYMSDIYQEKGDDQIALDFATRSLGLARQYGLKQEVSDASLKLSSLHERTNNYQEALMHFKNHMSYRDSVNNIASVQQNAKMRNDFEISQKQLEVDLLEQQRKNQRISLIASIITAVLIALLSIGLFRRNRYIRRTNKIIEEEKNRSQDLLLNILPEETAQELLEHGRVEAKRFDSVTVLFTDFKGFTSFAENLSPEKLVKSVDFYFSKFDEIMEKYNLEKIKTVGDAYLCAGGLPYPTEDHPQKMAKAALDILEFVDEARNESNDFIPFEIRIGIHTGPVVAGVVGSKKFAYDIWGDSVNVASRMETSADRGHINISRATYELIKEDFDCEFRGMIDVKGRGSMEMYYLRGARGLS